MDENITFMVKQVTIVHKQCTSCQGVGKKQQKIGPGMTKTVQCPHCKNGVTQHEIMTDISLKDALLKVGIVNLMQNTVNEILESKGSVPHELTAAEVLKLRIDNFNRKNKL